MKNFFHCYRLMILAFLFYVVGVVSDIISSLHFLPHLYETNPYTRGIFGRFVLLHGLAYDGAWLILLLAVSSILYFGLRRFSEMIAQSAFAAWFIFYALGRYAAAIQNVWLLAKWYVSNEALH